MKLTLLSSILAVAVAPDASGDISVLPSSPSD